MGLFSKSQVDIINNIAKKSQAVQAPKTTKKASSINEELNSMMELVQEYFKDSPAILIETEDQLHEYIDKCIESGFCGIDTETTGLDRNLDYIVGASLYCPNEQPCYISLKHRIPIFEDLYKGQLTYEVVAKEFQRFVDEKCKLIFANANFDLYMIWKDLKVDLNKAFFYDVILAWRCLKEDELHNDLKSLHNKYVLEGKGDPKKFSDFFPPALFPYCKPEVAKLYAANDAKITYDLFRWQLPYILKDNKKCQAAHLEHIADLIWNLEFPLVPVIQDIERVGMYIDQDTSKCLQDSYHVVYDKELAELKGMVDDTIEKFGHPTTNKKPPFNSGKDFNPRSTLHVKYLLYDMMKLPKVDGKEGTGVAILSEFNLPITNKIVDVRSLATNISTFIDKLPNATAKDGRIHANFKQVGAGTGRMSSSDPNLQNIPSKLDDVRHMFRATPESFEKIQLEGDCEYELNLNSYDQVQLDSEEFVSLRRLEPGNIVKFKDGKTDVLLTVKSVEVLGRYTKVVFS